MQKPKWQCRVAPSLGALEDTHQNTWGTVDYKDQDTPTVFFGLYGLPDFYTLWRHKGRKAVLWAGSDIRHFINGYWLDEHGTIRVEPEPLAEWLNTYCENYVENGVEAEALRVLGIESKIVPSFLGNVRDYDVSFEPNDRPKVYLSTGRDREIEYGFGIIEAIADKCDVDFYLYGSDTWYSEHFNVFVRGRLSKEVMNKEIQHMQCGLRLNEFDGFSEVTAKSILWGQYPITYIGFPHIDAFKTPEELIQLLNNLVNKTAPNMKARQYYIDHLNTYPWLSH